jgi:HD-GYP domain-containing protein (c-di-GMP phosphodiesterase class II)
MSNLIAKYPVYSHDNQLLVSAGTELTREYLDELCSHRKKSCEMLSLLQYGTFQQDLLRQFSIAPYDVIFTDSKTVTAILQVMEQVQLPSPLLDGLEYFKTNDFHTYRHMLMIFALSTLVAENLGQDYPELTHWELAGTGPTHDFGKITVPLPILLKKEPLTRSEFDLLRHHTLAGYVLLSHYLQDCDCLAAVIARDHHERKTGTGYPSGIIQKNIMVEIVAVCDIYDALIAPRPYRPVSYDNRTALEELTWMAQRSEINSDVVQGLVANNRTKKPSYKDFAISLERRGVEPAGNNYGKIVENGNDQTNGPQKKEGR